MPVLNSQGAEIAQNWTMLEDDAALPPDGDVIISLARLTVGIVPRAGRLGVLLAPEATREAVAPFVDRLQLIAVEFPKFRDGRGFSLARGLREQNGFTGEIRAVGHVLPDQFIALLRCGVSEVDVPEGQNIASWQAILQHSGLGDADRCPLPLLRRIAVPFAAEIVMTSGR